MEDTIATALGAGTITAGLLALVAELRGFLRDEREHKKLERAHWRREERMLRAIGTKLAAELPPDTVPISLDDVSDDDAA